MTKNLINTKKVTWSSEFSQHVIRSVSRRFYVSDVKMVFVQVQPDLEQLDVNMEDNEGAEETKEEMKLGKLQFSLDYDFQKGEVSNE